MGWMSANVVFGAGAIAMAPGPVMKVVCAVRPEQPTSDWTADPTVTA
jgi:hypothetical protein